MFSRFTLEANNKYVTRFSELHSRKRSLSEQLKDVLGRLLERSNPFGQEIEFQTSKKELY